MLKFNKTEIIKNLILITILIVVMSVFNMPLYKKINRINIKFTEARDEYSANFEQGNSYEKSLAQYNNLIDKLPTFENTFYSAGQELTLITELEGLASKHNLNQIIDLSSEKKELSENVLSMGLKLDLSGDFSDIVNYINDLESMKFKISINSLNLQKLGGDQLKASLLTNTYWQE